MTPEKRRSQLERAALRAAQKAQRRHPQTPVSREELLSLKIPTDSPWKRIVVASCGLFMSIAAVVVFLAENSATDIVASGFLFFFGLLVLWIGLRGHPQTVDDALSELGERGIEAAIDAIFRALD